MPLPLLALESWPSWIFPLATFFSGSIPTGLLIGKLKGIDIRQHGSKNIGATNVGRVLGRKYFFLCFSIDLLKGALPVLIAGISLKTLGRFDSNMEQSLWWIATMVCAVLGNVFSPWLKFRGGKGVATSLGALMGVFPVLAVPAAGAFVVWLIAYKTSGYISFASLAAAAALPIGVALTWYIAVLQSFAPNWNGAWPFIGTTTLLAILVFWTHRANIARLRAGTELRSGLKKA